MAAETAATGAGGMSSTRSLQKALDSGSSLGLYKSKRSGFKLSSSLFAGRASGADSYLPSTGAAGLSFDQGTRLDHDSRVYALLIDGRYDFDYDFGSNLPVRPFVQGGAGMALVGSGNAGYLASQDGQTVPLFRVGGGVTYRLDERWKVTLDYRTGMAGDQVYTTRGQQAVDLRSLNMGMSFKF